MPHSLLLPGRHDRLTELMAWLKVLAESYALPRRTCFALELVLTEAVTNVMDYGGAAPDTLRVELHADRLGHDLRVEIRDNGAYFNPIGRDETVLPSRLEEASVGGLGIHLIRRYTSSQDYRYQDGHNILTLTFPIDANRLEECRDASAPPTEDAEVHRSCRSGDSG